MNNERTVQKVDSKQNQEADGEDHVKDVHNGQKVKLTIDGTSDEKLDNMDEKKDDDNEDEADSDTSEELDDLHATILSLCSDKATEVTARKMEASLEKCTTSGGEAKEEARVEKGPVSAAAMEETEEEKLANSILAEDLSFGSRSINLTPIKKVPDKEDEFEVEQFSLFSPAMTNFSSLESPYRRQIQIKQTRAQSTPLVSKATWGNEGFRKRKNKPEDMDAIEEKKEQDVKEMSFEDLLSEVTILCGGKFELDQDLPTKPKPGDHELSLNMNAEHVSQINLNSIISQSFLPKADNIGMSDSVTSTASESVGPGRFTGLQTSSRHTFVISDDENEDELSEDILGLDDFTGHYDSSEEIDEKTLLSDNEETVVCEKTVVNENEDEDKDEVIEEIKSLETVSEVYESEDGIRQGSDDEGLDDSTDNNDDVDVTQVKTYEPEVSEPASKSTDGKVRSGELGVPRKLQKAGASDASGDEFEFDIAKENDEISHFLEDEGFTVIDETDEDKDDTADKDSVDKSSKEVGKTSVCAPKNKKEAKDNIDKSKVTKIAECAPMVAEVPHIQDEADKSKMKVNKTLECFPQMKGEVQGANFAMKQPEHMEKIVEVKAGGAKMEPTSQTSQSSESNKNALISVNDTSVSMTTTSQPPTVTVAPLQLKIAKDKEKSPEKSSLGMKREQTHFDYKAERDFLKNENALMNEVMKRWNVQGIQNPDTNLTCATRFREKHGNTKKGCLEGFHICTLEQKERIEDCKSPSRKRQKGNKFLNDINNLKTQLGEMVRSARYKAECLALEERREVHKIRSKHGQRVRNLSLQQEMEVRNLHANRMINPFMKQARLMQLRLEHENQSAHLQSVLNSELESLKDHYRRKYQTEGESFRHRRDQLSALIEQVTNNNDNEKDDQYGPHVTTNLVKAPCRANNNTASTVSVCLPANIATAILREDEVYDAFYSYD